MIRRQLLLWSLLLWRLVQASYDECQQYSTCASCLTSYFRNNKEQKPSLLRQQLFGKIVPHCQWNSSSSSSSDGSCHSRRHHDNNQDDRSSSIMYESDCPLSPQKYPSEPPTLLPDWMGTLLFNATNENNNITLSELSLPGTHDSLSYDLSLVVSKYDLDHHDSWSRWMHSLSQHIPHNAVEEFMRRQSKTQQLSLTEQLDNGVRFLDFRLISAGSDNGNYNYWYGTHFLQTKHTVDVYWNQLRDWLQRHPHEIVVLWLSRHGNIDATGVDQFPGTMIEEKQRLWNSTFLPMLFDFVIDTRVSHYHTTPVRTLIERHHRLIPIVSDWKEFTASSPYALNAAEVLDNHYHNDGGDLVEDGPEAFVQAQLHYFQQLEQDKQQQQQRKEEKKKITLLGMNTQSPTWLIESLAKRRFVPFSSKSSHSCKPILNSTTQWCPRSLLDLAQLSNYYNQYSINNESYNNNNNKRRFPMAWYLDALDYNGTIRTGCQVLDGDNQNDSVNCNASSYAWIDTILLYNLHQICQHTNNIDESCGASLKKLLEQRRQSHPFQMWSDPHHGRWRFAS